MKNLRCISLFLFCFFCHGLFAESKTLLVTGGAGFIGSNFVKYMFDKYEDYKIIVLDKLVYSGNTNNIPSHIRESARFSFVQGDICDPKVVDSLMAKANFVVHFAAETDVTRSICDDEPFFISNVMGTRNLLQYLIKYKQNVERFVHISSSEVYGTCAKNIIDEEHPLNARSPYAASKVGAERAVYAYGCTYDLPVVTLRCFNNYGPGQHLEKLVAKFTALSLSHQALMIHGDGQQMRDWMYVVDTAKAVDSALHVPHFEKIKNEVINCGTGVATSILDIAKFILANTDGATTSMKFVDDRPGQVFKHIASTDKAKNLLGWEATTSLYEGLETTIAWYKAHMSEWERDLDQPEIFKENRSLIGEKIGAL